MGQKILAVVKVFDRENRRITLTHKELLGTWLENASRFSEGDTVQGTVRGVMDYGCFVELAPTSPASPTSGRICGRGRGLRHHPLHPPGAHEDQITGH
ncbi:MAG: hypothetical protein ACLSHO_01295 [Dysosmobacter sp.]